MNKNILCCDWGTSSFRLRLVDVSDYRVIAEHLSSEGVAATFSSWQAAGSDDRFNFYASKLLSAISQLSQDQNINLSGIPVIVSGMASSSIGMEEIPYAMVPFSLDGSSMSSRVIENFNCNGGSLIIVSGVKTSDDVMRGEEAQLIGLLSLDEAPGADGEKSIFVFPGTHSKHMMVNGGIMTGFKTYMTGEIFNIMSQHSILKDSIKVSSNLTDPGNQDAFAKGVEHSGVSNVLNTLFSVRTNQLFSKYSREQNSLFLSGLLIGTELRELKKDNFGKLIICSGKHLYEHYRIAAGILDLAKNITFIQPELIDKATIAGQVRIFNSVSKFNE
ncbi:2-dehydro-3-deoxygalactonokinase [Daejeonella lutea]|uniref:2-dehydro-3-deoxygalactonokinase n=1 Tax=Daejeonella lutea TaxID=572036 RepID=A0A1T5ACC2_9SPHI|nr:2-dehydro-3-deoxygalactonokinase [Daejeonella lutea]SKB32417.1 2-dehydro-3-deoxygalactonokinase [Daejeonella lutea]